MLLPVSSRRRFMSIVIVFVFTLFAFAFFTQQVFVKSEDPGIGAVNLGDVRQMQVVYRGTADLVNAMTSGQVQARALAAADLNGDAAPDVVAGYEWNGTGVITVQRGNTDAFAPNDDSVFERMHQGYNPDPFVKVADVYRVPQRIDFLEIGDFDHDGCFDVLVAARGGDLYLLSGDCRGGLDAAERIDLPGTVTALTAGEFRAPDGWTDAAVAINSGGPELLIFDGASGLTGKPMRLALDSPASDLVFGEVDDSPFMGLAASGGGRIEIVHGWGRNHEPDINSRVETIDAGVSIVSLANGFFLWNREGRKQLAALGDDGTIRFMQYGKQDTRPLSDDDLEARAKSRLRQTRSGPDAESLIGWEANSSQGWSTAREISAGGSAVAFITKAHISPLGTDDLIVGGDSGQQLSILHEIDPSRRRKTGSEIATGEFARTGVGAVTGPVAAVELKQRLNGERDLITISAGSTALTMTAFAPTATIIVDRTDDPSGGALTAASACTVAANDCSLRGAVQFANINPGTVITLGTATYTLSINGIGGCVTGDPVATGNTIGDLEMNTSTTINGNGSALTIINQIGVGNAAHPGDRVICQNVPLAPGLTYSLTGLTIAGGRDITSNVGGGGIIGGARNTTLNMTDVRVVNNQSTGPNISGGGGVAVTGGDMNVANCTFGGANNPGASRTDLTLGNAVNSNSGGGISYSPGDPLGIGGATGILTVTGTTFTRNTASSMAAGGGGLLTFNFNTSTGTANVSTSAFTNNQATVASGGGIFNESLTNVNVSTTSFTSNSAANRGGGIYVGGGSLTLIGTGAGVVMSNNTAPNGGSSVSTASRVNVTGATIALGGDIEVTTNGHWINGSGSNLTPTNINVVGGTLSMCDDIVNMVPTCNNGSTMNVLGNLTLQSGAVVGGVFNGGAGTINVAGNFSYITGPAVPTFNANATTFNFNGTGAQSLSNSASITFNNLSDSNTTNPLTLNNSFAVNGTLNVNGANATLAPVATSIISGTGTLTGTGTARVTRIAATAGFGNQYTITNKTLTNLTVDYVGTAAQVLTTLTYGPLRINNASGVNMAAGTSTVNGLLTLTSGALGVGTTTLVINNGTSVGAGSITSSVTGTVNYNQGSAGQDVRAFNYGNLTFSNQNKVLANSGTIGISGTFSPGTAVGHTITGSTIDFNGTGAQTIPAFNYNNLTISGARGINNVTLPNGGTIGVAGAFSPTATFAGGTFVITNNTVNFNGAGSQTIPAFNFNNLTSSNAGARTLAGAGTIGIAAVFTPGANSYTVTGSTVNFNGAVAQNIPAFNYNHLSSSNVGMRTLPNGGTVGVAGNFTPGANAYTITGSTLDFNGGGSQAIPGFNYNNLTSSSVGARTLTNGATIGIANVFTPGANAYTVTGSTVNFNGSVGQSIPAFNYNNLTSSSTGARTLPNGGTVGIAGVFTPGTNVYTITGSTVAYNGAALQTLPVTFTTYNNLTINNPVGATGFAGLTVQGVLRIQAGTFTTSSNFNNVQIDVGAVLNATAASTINVTGNWVNNGTFNGNTGTVNLIGSAPQNIGGSFSNLTVNNAAGVNLTNATTVNGTLDLMNGAMNVGSNSLTVNSTVTGASGLTSNANGTVNYNQSSNGQNVLAAQYGNLTFSNFTKILPNVGTVGIAGAFTTGAGGGHTVTGSTVAFNGSSPQTLPPFTPYSNLTVNNAGGLTLTTDVTHDGILTLTSGNISTGISTLTIGGTGTISRTDGHIIGNLRKNFSGPGPLFEMPVGTSGAFSPLSVTVTNGSGQLTVRANTGVPVPTPSGVDPLRTLQRYWTLSGTGIRSNITFNYLDGDVPGPPNNENLWAILRITGTTAVAYPDALPYVVMDPANNRFTIDDLESYSDWTAGEVLAPTAASVSVAGRVVNPEGYGISGARVAMQDQAGNIVLSITNAFGYYSFTSVQSGQTYILSLSHKRYQFQPRALTVNEDLTGVDFVGESGP